jgi:DNA-binding transcriptional LysR family regulator
MIKETFTRQLDWNLLKVFHEIVREGGLSSAAQQIGRKQPAVSLALKRLESRLNVVLCRRGPGGFELTDEGQLVAELCGRMTAMVAQLPNRIANLTEDVRGRIRVQIISSLVSASLDVAIFDFHRRYPGVEIVMDVATWDAVGRSLRRGEIDVGVAPARLFHRDLSYDLLFREIHRPYCGLSHELFGRKIGQPQELAEHAFILTGADEPDQLTEYRLRFGLGTHVAGLSEHLEEAKRLTALGVGICFLPVGFALPEVEKGTLWPLLPNSTEPAMDIFIITNPTAPRHLARELLLEELWRQIGRGGRSRPLRTA